VAVHRFIRSIHPIAPLQHFGRLTLQSSSEQDVVIAVDLDGTLSLSDTLHESALKLFGASPHIALLFPFWLVAGKAVLKARISERAALNPQTQPYNRELLAWLAEQKAAGRKLALCTAADHRIANAIADHLGIFDYVFASDGKINLSGDRKRVLLEEQFGARGFDYVGNSAADVPIWAGARRAIVVNASASTHRKAGRVAEIGKTLPRHTSTIAGWARALRVHQWIKNLLLFVPLVAAHRAGDLPSLLAVLAAFFAFCLCASAVYILNDLLDLEHDRRHPRKRHRPFASASMSLADGVAGAFALAAACLFFTFYAGASFAGWLLGYFLLTCAYSLWLKRIVLVDGLTLAALYTLRIIAGAAAAGVPLSFWLLAFSTFMFLSLAFVKRYAELQLQAAQGQDTAHGRGYLVTDAPLVQTLGIASGYAAVTVLALYLNGETVVVLYQTPQFIWAAIPLMLFWVNWVWLKAHRNQMHDDPIVFAVKDRASQIVAALTVAVFGLASVLKM
jgi:4-hydroxybenzoate polyprenyltransferase/phosphoserine phosphatase